MVDLRGFVANLVTSGLSSSADPETLHRVRLVNVLAAIPAVYLLVFSIPHWLAGRYVSSLTQALGAAALVGIMVYLRITRDVRTAALLTCGIAFVVCLVRLHYLPPVSFGYFWSLMMPLLAVFTLGHRLGGAVGLGYIALAAVALWWRDNPFLVAEVDPSLRVRLLATLCGILVSAYYVEWARNHTRQALVSNEHRFRALIENGVSVYAITGRDGSILYESPSLKRVYGYDPEELVGTNILEQVHPDDREAALLELGWLLQNPGRVKTVQTRYRHGDGSWRDIEVSGVSLLEDPAVQGVVLTSHDITERCDAERELRALNESLEERVRQRTDELAQSEARLRQSEKMEAIGRLAGGIAHDFNNQLAAILCCLDLLKISRRDDSRATSALDAASTAARRAADLTSQLLAFARKGSRFTESVELHGIVHEVIALLGHSIDKRIEIREDLPDDALVVTGDSTQLHSALLNLALNARDAMPDGGTITFSARLLTVDRRTCEAEGLDLEPGRYAVLSVADTGEGLTDEVRERAFEPFFTTKPAGEGTGMGLAAVYGTARVHRGAVTVASAPGRGSTFSLYLPASREVAGLARTPTPIRDVNAPRLKILVVDDEPTLRETVTAALEALGHEVFTCGDGEHAIEMYRDRGPAIDVVVLDMMMPKLNGRQTFLALHDLDPEVCVLLASGYSVDREAEAALAAGAAGFIQKPFRMTELNRRLIELASIRRQGATASSVSPLRATR